MLRRELPEYVKFKHDVNNDNIDPLEYVLMNYSLSQVTAISALFVPEFIVHQGHVFLEFQFSVDGFNRWLEHFKGDQRQVQIMLNHVHLAFLFVHDDMNDDNTDETCKLLAPILRDAWEGALKIKFPHLKFVMDLQMGDEEEFDPVILFYQVT